MRLYAYVGPDDIRAAQAGAPAGRLVRDPEDVRGWARETRQEANREQLVMATYTVDAALNLRIADYGVEHVACAAGGPIAAAGVAWFELGATVTLARIDNQSTGFCPDLPSWEAAREALLGIGLAAPAGFEPRCIFRRCPSCEQRNLVKDGWFVCALCDAALPEVWNFSAP